MSNNKRRVTFCDVIDRFDLRIEELKNTRDRSNPQDPNIFRIRAYQDVIREIKSSFSLRELVTYAKIDRLEITNTMAEKIKNFLINPNAIYVGPSHVKTKDRLKKELLKIKGIGNTKANELITAGITSISELKKAKYKSLLTNITRSYIKHNPMNKILRTDIRKIEQRTEKIKIKHIYVGSYRRGKDKCGDVDILVVGNGNVLQKFKQELKKVNFTLWVYSEGKNRISTIAKIPGIARKIKFDFFRSAPNELATQLLYSTGSSDFNQIMRGIAKRKGFLLNQHGLYKNSKKISTPTEKTVFNKLDMKYRTPKQRI